MSRTPARFTEADVNRALKAAKRQWGDDARVEVLADGTIRIERRDGETVRLDAPEEIRL